MSLFWLILAYNVASMTLNERMHRRQGPLSRGVVSSAPKPMSYTIRCVSFALERLSSSGRSASLAELREVIEAEFGAAAAAVPDAELREALLKLHGPAHPSSAIVQPGASVTCSPMPEGWIPLDQFRRGC